MTWKVLLATPRGDLLLTVHAPNIRRAVELVKMTVPDSLGVIRAEAI